VDIDRTAYPFESRWIDLPDGRMHYVDQGAGEPIIFVHGTPTWSFEWRHLIRTLGTGRRCIAADHLGFGLSDRPVLPLEAPRRRGRGSQAPPYAPYTPQWHAEHFEQFVTKLAPGRFTLAVHDFGGPIALPFCLRHPELVMRLVIINSWMWSFEGDADMQKKGRIAGSALGRFLYRWANFSLRVITPSAYADKRRLTPGIHRMYLDRFPDRWSREAVLWTLARSLLDSSGYYETLWQQRDALRGRPALIVWGMKDTAFRPHLLARWRDALPSATVAEIADAGHWPHEEQAEEVVAVFQQFLEARG
jgi:haloalkane dehalogenase